MNTKQNALQIKVPFAVRSTDCLPAPSKEVAPGTRGGISLSSIGPTRWQIRNRWSGATCLLDKTWSKSQVLITVLFTVQILHQLGIGLMSHEKNTPKMVKREKK
jgi:hypothetical protein